MFGLGILLGLFDKVLLRSSSGLLLNSIGVSLVPGLLPVDAQLAQYIAGLGQQIVIALILFAPMFDLHRGQNYRGISTFVGRWRQSQEETSRASRKSLTGRDFT
jgi:hypothetical protein